ncbi:MAG: ATP synthase subunit I [Polaromonas sp.]|nr:ATP synthase subunit I [Polaromonas sp.]
MTEQTQAALLAKSASERDIAEDGLKGEMDFIPLTREQAQRLREQEPPVSIWWIVLGQLAVGLVAALVAWGATDKSHVAWSVLYGALAVVIPGALFARGLTSQFSSISPVTAGFGFFVWEAVKIGVSVGMLAAAPRLVADLDWLAMLIGLILALKVYWLALLLRHKRKTA